MFTRSVYAMMQPRNVNATTTWRRGQPTTKAVTFSWDRAALSPPLFLAAKHQPPQANGCQLASLCAAGQAWGGTLWRCCRAIVEPVCAASLWSLFSRCDDRKFEIPAGACDCHFHIFDDPQRFPFWAGRTYTPEMATVSDCIALHRALHWIGSLQLTRWSTPPTTPACWMHSGGVISVNVDPDSHQVRKDPRYKAFLRKMNLPE
jgi:hypothetical protein